VRVAEDAMFYRHGGVDWHEVRASVREWWSDEESLRGASTITMQLARNLHLSPERSLLRKAREVLLAIRLERRLPKDRILELYLNVVELGPGVFGVEAAARHYWRVSVSELDRRQAAELAATLPSPLEDNPRTRTRRFLWRADLIQRRAFGADTAEAGTVAPDSMVTPPPGADTLGPDTTRRPLPAPDTAGSSPPDTAEPASEPG
jgi:monofunctional biosynthetic peptidoglycan transglycosylase